MSNGPDWNKHEAEMQELLHLSATSGSGNKWHDISDGVTRGHYSKIAFPLMIDAKATLKKSYGLSRDFFLEWIKKAGLEGKKFMMPVRFEVDNKTVLDLMVVPLDVFLPMYEVYINYLENVESKEAAEMIAKLISTIGKPDLRKAAQDSLNKLRAPYDG